MHAQFGSRYIFSGRLAALKIVLARSRLLDVNHHYFILDISTREPTIQKISGFVLLLIFSPALEHIPSAGVAA